MVDPQDQLEQQLYTLMQKDHPPEDLHAFMKQHGATQTEYGANIINGYTKDYQARHKKVQPRTPNGAMGTFVEQAADSATFGAIPKMTGGLAALGVLGPNGWSLPGGKDSIPTVFNSDRGFMDLAGDYSNQANQIMDENAHAHPVAATAGEWAPALIPGRAALKAGERGLARRAERQADKAWSRGQHEDRMRRAIEQKAEALANQNGPGAFNRRNVDALGDLPPRATRPTAPSRPAPVESIEVFDPTSGTMVRIPK